MKKVIILFLILIVITAFGSLPKYAYAQQEGDDCGHGGVCAYTGDCNVYNDGFPIYGSCDSGLTCCAWTTLGCEGQGGTCMYSSTCSLSIIGDLDCPAVGLPTQQLICCAPEPTETCASHSGECVPYSTNCAYPDTVIGQYDCPSLIGLSSAVCCVQGNATCQDLGYDCTPLGECNDEDSLPAVDGCDYGTVCCSYESGNPGDEDWPIVITPRPTRAYLTCHTADGSLGVNTAIGCIPTDDSNDLASFLLRWGLGIGGGIGLVLIAASGIIITLSGGNPDRLQNGKNLLTAAIVGLSLIIFSAFTLQLVGVDILKLPGF